MFRWVTKRILTAAISLVVFSFVMFWAVETLIPGDFFSIFRLGMTADEVDALREQAGVLDPIWERWWRWLQSFVSGSFGDSTTGTSFALSFGPTIAPTIFVFLSGLTLAYLIGQWLGRITGWRRTLGSDALTLGGIGFSTLFPPFVGFVIVTVLATRLRTWRAVFFEDVRRTLWLDPPFSESQILTRMTITLILGMVIASFVAAWVWRARRRRLPPLLTGILGVAIMIGLWFAMGIAPWAFDLLFEAALPMIAFTILGFGEFMLITQTGIVGDMNEDYVTTGRAKGLSEGAVRDRHVARNATVAVVARLVVSLPYLLTGLVIIEESVGWDGIGTFLFNAIEAQDIPLVISALMVIGIVTVVVRFALDFILYTLDPRISHPVRQT